MPVFVFKAVDRSGKELVSEVEASSQEDARTLISGKGLHVTAIKERPARQAAKAAPAPGQKKVMTIGGVNRGQLTEFTTQLATLVDAGVPLPRSLAILEGQAKPGVLKNHLMDVTEDVETGSNLAESLAKHPKVFDNLYVNMVRAGQVGGVLDKVLARLAEFMEKSQKLRRKVISASVYPAMVSIVAVVILSAIMIFVIPKFKEIFEKSNTPMPGVTVALLNVSSGVVTYKFVILGIPLSLFILFKVAGNTPKGKLFLDRVKLRVPLSGTVIRKATIARFARTLGTLVASGVEILDALRICRDAIDNEMLARAINKVHDSIREGESIADPLRDSGMFTELVVNMVAVGEETGQLDKMLIKVADVYDEEVDVAVDAMTSALEPALILFMGVAVGFIVIALFLPLIQIIKSQKTKTGG